ncbi:MAG TPA: D-tyrosyl-tRNA(Tyr) deacylase [Candidatus Omnitrophica bacterium]|nr:MAG: D-tyrosyl-tRNA(Tyr) deacylase [Candidatus Omnitrophota bacterium]RKY34825.1 MAG: D-tyrosyl-tRNA(Tyr) deacylase [Candidatus Omnitrophota bacterium]RKY43857.1 MAG: D-tyrosyl-tRNA(Tyr) deacylase [Candidatus Omnitrophota bacterium]HEC70074.1 D-tyrosyl-tRNA(Tyr) deacylase [Candidatus Omnitrophota bacterium]
MKAVVQRVEKASLFIKEKETLKFIGEIGKGLLVFVGIEQEDTTENLYFLADKLSKLRVFEDEKGKLNFSVKDKNFEVMLIPNFTLCASLDKGRRPSFEKAASFNKAKEYFYFLTKIFKDKEIKCREGVFGASMIIEAKNYGPVNIILSG